MGVCGGGGGGVSSDREHGPHALGFRVEAFRGRRQGKV